MICRERKLGPGIQGKIEEAIKKAYQRIHKSHNPLVFPSPCQTPVYEKVSMASKRKRGEQMHLKPTT
jgi:hypothetical protein